MLRFVSSRFLFSNFLVKTMIRATGADNTFHLIFRSVFAITPPLLMNYGILPVFRVYYQLYKFATKGLKLANFPVEFYNNYNPAIVKRIIENIIPFWDGCIGLNTIFFKSLWMYFIFAALPLTSIKPILYFIFRYGVGTVLTSLGIMLNETLYAITYLKSFAEFVVSFIPVLNPIKHMINIVTDIINSNDLPSRSKVGISNRDIINDTGSWLAIIGTCVIGLGVLLVGLCVADTFSVTHDTVRSIPGTNIVLDSIYSVYHSLCNYIFGNGGTPSAPTNPTESLTPLQSDAESITRSTSTGSDITITDARTPKSFPLNSFPTPDSSRPSTPTLFPTDNYIGSSTMNYEFMDNPFNN